MPLFRYLKRGKLNVLIKNMVIYVSAAYMHFISISKIMRTFHPRHVYTKKKKQKSLSTKTTYIYVLDPRIPFSLLNQSICKNVKRRILSIEPIQIFIVHLTNKRERERRYMIIISLKKDFYR